MKKKLNERFFAISLLQNENTVNHKEAKKELTFDQYLKVNQIIQKALREIDIAIN